MAMMYPMKGLSCVGATGPFAIPLARGDSGLKGTMLLGPPLGMRTGSLPGFSLAAEPLAIGEMSDECEENREPGIQTEPR